MYLLPFDYYFNFINIHILINILIYIFIQIIL